MFDFDQWKLWTWRKNCPMRPCFPIGPPLCFPCPTQMSKPSTWLLTFRDGLESTFSASIRKLESLFADNAMWIEDQRRIVRVAKEENERQLKAHQDALAAVNASVKKPRGRPKKNKATIEKAVTVICVASHGLLMIYV